MTYEKIVAAVKKAVAKKDVSKVADMALSIYISGEGEGEFYIAVKDGKMEIEKYRYEDYTAHISATADELLKAVEGQGKALKVDDGDSKKIAALTGIIFPKKASAAKKPTTAKKTGTTQKAETAKKTGVAKKTAPAKKEAPAKKSAPAKKAITSKK